MTNIVKTVRVRATSRSVSVAGAIAGIVREDDKCIVQAIGAGAVNQAVKAIAMARAMVWEDGLDLMVMPCFSEVELEGQKTVVQFHVFGQASETLPDVPRPDLRAHENGNGNGHAARVLAFG